MGNLFNLRSLAATVRGNSFTAQLDDMKLGDYTAVATAYAKGSDDVLGNHSSTSASMLETRPGYWTKVDACCP